MIELLQGWQGAVNKTVAMVNRSGEYAAIVFTDGCVLLLEGGGNILVIQDADDIHPGILVTLGLMSYADAKKKIDAETEASERSVYEKLKLKFG